MGEISELVNKSKNGDAVSFEKLLSQYGPMITSLVKRYSESLPQADKDDFIQEAKLAFYNAVITYDGETKKVAFGAYAKVCVRNKLVSYIRKITSQKMRKNVAYNEQYAISGSLSANDREVSKELMEKAKSCLSPYEMKIFKCYAQGERTKDIAPKFNRSAKSVNNAICRIKSKLKRTLNNGT